MKKACFLLFLLGFIAHIQAQVGINTIAPKASLHVAPANGTTADGIIAPNLTLAQLATRDAQYNADQTGAFVYVTNAIGTPSPKTVYVITPGYYYFDGSFWKHFNDKLQTANNGLSVTSSAEVQLGGTLTKNTQINTNSNKLSIVGTGATTGLQLPTGASLGDVLTSDAQGNATWNAPGFSDYRSIPYQKLTFTANAEFVDSGFYFDFPSAGVYAVCMQITINSVNGFTLGSGAYKPAIQFVPKLASSSTADVTTAWNRPSPRFLGSSELFGSDPFFSPTAGLTKEIRFNFNQNITVTNGSSASDTGLRAYLIFYLLQFTAGDTITMIIGNNPGTNRPQSSSGSFIRIN